RMTCEFGRSGQPLNFLAAWPDLLENTLASARSPASENMSRPCLPVTAEKPVGSVRNISLGCLIMIMPSRANQHGPSYFRSADQASVSLDEYLPSGMRSFALGTITFCEIL